MSAYAAATHDPVIVRADAAEHLPEIGHILLADASASKGALSARHNGSSELFFIIDGALDLLIESEIVTARSGDLLIVPPRSDHAFRTHPNNTADALILITPGIERFDYLRHVARIRRGEASRDSILHEQDRYDTHFVHSSIW